MMRIDLPVSPNLLTHCRNLIRNGVDPETVVHVYRGETLCFTPTRLGTFAALTTQENDRTSIRFSAYSPYPSSLRTAN